MAVPTDLSGLKLWLKASALGLSDGNAVGTWPDSSGLLNAFSSGEVQGPRGGTTFVDDGSIGSQAWINPGNARDQDNVWAQVTTAAGGTAHYLKVMGFGFSIPPGATIDGIVCEVEGHSSGGGVWAQSVKLVKGGAITGADRGSGYLMWPSGADAVLKYGDTGDLWGTTWTLAQINDPAFGVVISTASGGLTQTSFIDQIRITVYYTPSGGGSGGPTSPTYKSAILHGLPVVRFDGTDDYLSGPDFMHLEGAGEVFVVMKQDADPPATIGNGPGFWQFGSEVGGAAANHVPWQDQRIYDGWGSDARKSFPKGNMSGWSLYNVQTESARWKARLNRNLLYDTPTNTVGWRTTPRLGRAENAGTFYYFDGDIAEIIVFNRALTDPERTQMEDYVADRYSILPNSHTLGKHRSDAKISVGVLRQPPGWTAAPLLGGWTAYGAPIVGPAFRMNQYGVVELRGGVKGGSGVIFQLPLGYRPTYTEIFTGTHWGAPFSARVDIDNLGQVSFISGNNQLVELSSIQFRASALEFTVRFGSEPSDNQIEGRAFVVEGWSAVTLQNSWLHYGAPFSVPGYWKDPAGFVHLRGLLKNGALYSPAFTLPAGYLPANGIVANVHSGGALGFLDVTTTGGVVPGLGCTNSYVSLDGIVFRAA